MTSYIDEKQLMVEIQKMQRRYCEGHQHVWGPVEQRCKVGSGLVERECEWCGEIETRQFGPLSTIYDIQEWVKGACLK